MKKASGYWKNNANVRKFFDRISENVGVKKLDDWYKVDWKDVKSIEGGTSVQDEFEGSFLSALKSAYPEHNWKSYKFGNNSRSFWENRTNQETFFNDLSKELGLKNPEDWYQPEEVRNAGGSSLLNSYKNLPNALQTIYPKYNWRLWRFEHRINIVVDYWKDKKVREDYMMDLRKKCKLDLDVEDLYNLTSKDILEFKGKTLLEYYSKRDEEAVWMFIKDIYSEHKWSEERWKYHHLETGFWVNQKYRKEFFDFVAKELNITHWEQWYQVSMNTISKFGGKKLFPLYGNSFIKAIMETYPEKEWLPWKFQVVPRGFWDEKENINLVVKWLSKQFQIENLDDWYLVSYNQVVQLGCGQLLKRYGGLKDFLVSYYPNHNWDFTKIPFVSNVVSKSQKQLFTVIKDEFKKISADIFVGYLHPQAKFKSGELMELDIYIPDLKLGIEYQGRQHKEKVEVFENSETQQNRDAEKREKMEQLGVSLIEVPSTWDGSKESLKVMIKAKRPDIIFEDEKVPWRE